MKNAVKMIAVMTIATLSFASSPATAGPPKPERLTTSNDPRSACSHVWFQGWTASGRKTVYDLHVDVGGRFTVSAVTRVFHGSYTDPESCSRKPYVADRIVHKAQPAVGFRNVVFTLYNYRNNVSVLDTQIKKIRDEPREISCVYSVHNVVIRGKNYRRWSREGSKFTC